ncbi:hypothetical protein B0H19DRAFT_1374117 [Mycena capillaripes]|nr:hypothetical protein B0H19DRAFT_1374117 [Mycena capillaripes]
MPFIDLGTNVLLHLFALVDAIYTVLSLSRVNRLLHEFGSTKHLWLSIVRDLTARRLIDAHPDDLAKLSKDALVEEVRRAVNGPQTWSPKSLVPPTLARQVVVQVDRFRFAEFLPGSCAISGTIAPGIGVDSATLHFRIGTSAAVVALILSATNRHELFVLELDLATGESSDLLRISLTMTLWGPRLFEDFLVCYTSPGPPYVRWFILLLNWRAEEFVFVVCNTDQPHGSFALTPGHVVLIRPVSGPSCSTAGLSVHLYPIINFEGLWRPLSELNINDPIHTEQISCVSVQVPDNNIFGPRQHPTLSLTGSLLHHDTYDLTIQVADIIFPPPAARLSSLLERLRIRPQRSRTRMTHVTISRHHITLAAQGHSVNSPPLPQLTMRSIFRYSRDFDSTWVLGSTHG